LDFSADENDVFNQLYSAEFAKMIKGDDGTATVNKEDPSAGGYAFTFVDTWNENAANYRRNAPLCVSLPGALATGCLY
jgi:hypothetical protein